MGKSKTIYGNNCIAHLDGLRNLMDGVNNLLKKDGIFVVECNYWGGMVDNINYSLIYRSLSYFSLSTFSNFAKKHKLYAFDAVVTPAQEGSLRIFMSKKKTN